MARRLALVATLCGCPVLVVPQASALIVSKTAARYRTFAGVGCGASSTRYVPLPPTAGRVMSTRPLVGTALPGLETADPVARLIASEPQRRTARASLSLPPRAATPCAHSPSGSPSDGRPTSSTSGSGTRSASTSSGVRRICTAGAARGSCILAPAAICRSVAGQAGTGKWRGVAGPFRTTTASRTARRGP